MQRAPDRYSKCPGNAHRIILLQPRNRIAYFRRKHTVDGPAVITQTTQRRLHGPHISGLCDELLAILEVVTPSPLIAWRKVGGVQMGALMYKSQFASLSQRIE